MRRPAASGTRRRRGTPLPRGPTSRSTTTRQRSAPPGNWTSGAASGAPPRPHARNSSASEEGRRAVILSLVGSVAGSYVNLRDLDRQLEIAKETAKSRGDSLALFKLRFEGGFTSEVEYVQVKSQYEEAMAIIPAVEKAITQQENALSVLLGRNPGPISRGKTIDQLALPSVPAGLPSDLLSRRPDILLAEQNLIAANARIGVAKAAYYPAISLTGFFGSASTDLSNLFTGPAQVWSYSAPVSLPIFTAGKIAGDVQAAEAFQRQTLFGYRQAIQTAFREVDDALVDQARTREQLAAQASQVEALQKYVELAQLRFDNGYASYLEVLDAQRSLFNVAAELHPEPGGPVPGHDQPVQGHGRRLGDGGGQADRRGGRPGAKGFPGREVIGRLFGIGGFENPGHDIFPDRRTYRRMKRQGGADRRPAPPSTRGVAVPCVTSSFPPSPPSPRPLRCT